MKRPGVALTLLPFLTGWVQAQNASADVPLALLNGVTVVRDLRVVRDVPYGPLPRQTLDVYGPRTGDDHPVVVFVHGGSWTGFNKEDFKFVGESFARAGYVTAVINYRLAPQTRYPGFVQDTVKAFRWVKDHIGAHHGDARSIFVMGHSAGAYNVVMGVVNTPFLQQEGLKATDFKGVIGIAGPYDFEPYAPAFTPEHTRKDTMPARKVHGVLPPFLLLKAEKDTVVHPFNFTSMVDALQKNHTRVQAVEVPGVGHAEILAALSRRLQAFLPPVRQTILDFMQQALKAPSTRGD